jgi:hypothetical protein
MKLSSRITVAFALAFIPLGIALAAPGNVTGIKGEAVNGKAHVSWQKPAGEEPVNYRIFYSRQSILQQNGLYDDFETVPAASLDYTFDALPYAADVLYVSVLAVSAKGEESPLFLEEARIQLTAAQTNIPSPGSSAMAQPTPSSASFVSSAAPASGVIRMLSAKAISATGVLVTFSDTVSISPADAAQAFLIKDASGALLRVTRLVILGKEVTIHTVKQERSRVYRLEATDAIGGLGAQGTALKIDPQQSDVLFTGHETGLPYGSTVSSFGFASRASSSRASVAGPSFPQAVEDIRNLVLRGQDEGDSYRIEASWQAPNASGIREYKVSQSRDGGRTYGKSQTVPASANGLNIDEIPGGSFALQVQTVYTDGRLSRGVSQSITLPLKGIPGKGKGTVGSIIEKPAQTGGQLPSSGIALGLPVVLSGMGVGFQMWRRKRMQEVL